MAKFRYEYSLRCFLSLVSFGHLLKSAKCSFQDRIRVTDKEIFIAYDDKTGFEHTVDTSLLDPNEPRTVSADGSSWYLVEWKNVGNFKIIKRDDTCEDYQFQTTVSLPVKVTFDTSKIYLFGGRQHANQSWPSDTLDHKPVAFVSSQTNGQSVLEPYWLASNGIYLYVSESTPLFVAHLHSNNLFEIVAEKEPPYLKGDGTILRYRVCRLHDLKVAHLHAINNVLGKPTAIPDVRIVKHPIWSLPVALLRNATQDQTSVILEYAQKLTQHNLPNSRLELRNPWETCYGSMTVTSFTRDLTRKLKTLGYRVTTRVHPFVNEDCEPFHQLGRSSGFFVRNQEASERTRWPHGSASHVDFTNSNASQWFRNRLRRLLETAAFDESFSFDAGESGWSPQLPVFRRMESDHPETILQSYVEAASAFGNGVIVRVARRTQKYSLFLRMADRQPNWAESLGLQTIIPCVLTLNLLGYPFLVSEVGGAAAEGEITDEMFVRWVQIVTFTPAMHISYPPWEFNEKVIETTKTYIDLHAKYADTIVSEMNKAVSTGSPVNPPIWWADPQDPETYRIGDEFLLGEDLLVAPIVKEGACYRDIYLPKGIWKDELNSENGNIQGPVWLHDYEVPLEKLAYFTKVRSVHHEANEANAKKSNATTIYFLILLAVLCTLFRTNSAVARNRSFLGLI